MDYRITQTDARNVAGFHLVGPWEKTVKQGFEQLVLWVESNQLSPREWMAVYYDNPEEVPAEKLRCATVVAVEEGFAVPENSAGVILTQIDGGDYAVARARVENHDFAAAWYQFFDSLLKDERYSIVPRPTFEAYLNDGNAEGYWEIEMYVPVALRG